MDLNIGLETALKVVIAFIVSVGGAGAIIIAVSKWFGDFLAKRMLDHYNNQHESELAKIKNDYQTQLESTKLELDKARTSFVRYSERQFELYNNIWFSLLYMKRQADELWQVADPIKIPGFAEQVRLAKNSVEDNMLLIEQEHYDKLIRLISQFENFKVGKVKLIDVRSSQALEAPNILQEDADAFINKNKSTKKLYDKLVLEIGETFRRQIKG